jgi:hypothetical protein
MIFYTLGKFPWRMVAGIGSLWITAYAYLWSTAKLVGSTIPHNWYRILVFPACLTANSSSIVVQDRKKRKTEEDDYLG